MGKPKSFPFFGGRFTIEAATATEARSLADGAVEATLSQGIAPEIVSNPKYPCIFGILFAYDLSQWGYQIVDLSDGGVVKAGSVYAGSISGGTRSQVRGELCRHLAQSSMVIEDDHRTGLEFLSNPEERKDHLRYLAWQRDFRRLRRERPELSDTEIHGMTRSDMSLVSSIVV